MATIDVSPEDVEQMGKVCKSKSGEIGGLIKELNGKVAGVHWRSDAKGKFDKDWDTYKITLGKLQTALDELGDAAVKMAANYRRADEAYKG